MRRSFGRLPTTRRLSRVAALAAVGGACAVTVGLLTQSSLAAAATPTPTQAPSAAPRAAKPPHRPAATPTTVDATRAPEVCLPGRTEPKQLAAAFGHRGPGWAGADLTSTVALGDGRTLWLFGDTFVGAVTATGARAPGTVMVNNSVIVQTGDCFRPLLGGTPTAPAAWIAPVHADGSWYWPSAAVVDGGRLHVLLMHVVDRGQPIGHTDGMHRATLRLPELSLERIVAIPDSGRRNYGMAASYDGRHTYLWGPAQRRGSYGRALYVARAPRHRLGRAPLKYWTGRGWSRDARKARAVIGDDLGHQLTVRPHDGGWLAVSKRAEFMSDELGGWWAPRPEGPWRSLGALLRVPKDPTPGTFTYMGGAPGSSQRADGRLLVAWNVNTLDAATNLADAALYGPRFALVTVPPVR